MVSQYLNIRPENNTKEECLWNFPKYCAMPSMSVCLSVTHVNMTDIRHIHSARRHFLSRAVCRLSSQCAGIQKAYKLEVFSAK